MITPFKNRAIDPDVPVEVYLNLHKKDADGKAWYSIRQRGKVVAHADEIQLIDVTLVVNEKGRDKVRREKRKNVHAWLKGFMPPKPIEGHMWHHLPVTYNPYRDDRFMCANAPIDRLAMIDCFAGGKLYT